MSPGTAEFDTFTLALQGGVTAEAEGSWVAGREPWRLSMWELVESMEIEYFLVHRGWKVVGVAQSK